MDQMISMQPQEYFLYISTSLSQNTLVIWWSVEHHDLFHTDRCLLQLSEPWYYHEDDWLLKKSNLDPLIISNYSHFQIFHSLDKYLKVIYQQWHRYLLFLVCMMCTSNSSQINDLSFNNDTNRLSVLVLLDLCTAVNCDI